MPSLIGAAKRYLRRGWVPVYVPPGVKGPVREGWQRQRLTEADLPAHFGRPGNIGILLGKPSKDLVDADLDCPEAVELADRFLPPTPAVTGHKSAPRSHRWYIADVPATKQFRDPHTRKMIVELRGTGGQTLVGPSIHTSGEPYDPLEGEPARVPGPMLEACVKALHEAVIRKRYGSAPDHRSKATMPARPAEIGAEALERRALAYLDAMPPAISGQGGHNAAYAAATALVHGFGIAPERALDLLLAHYNPRCVPAWTEKELRHKVEDAAAKPHEQPFGWLRDQKTDPERSVDFSALLPKAAPPEDETPPAPLDPGPMPDDLLRVPGFVSEVMDHCLDVAPYPSVVMAFSGALVLQAVLAGRKVRDPGDNRTNIYLLGLAYSSVGKNKPREINNTVLKEAGLEGYIGGHFASGEGLQDALGTEPCMLFQTDEIDTILQSINKARDGRHEQMMATLLTMYSSASSSFAMRRKAGKEPPGSIDQPCLVVFGTAIPNHYYQALSERMLTNGFFARMIVLECEKRAPGQEPRIAEIPSRIFEVAKWWAEFRPGNGNLEKWHPVPVIVPHTEEAKGLLVEMRLEAEAEYGRAEDARDPVGTTVWGRVSEHVRKLALIHAISEDHKNPRIGKDAVLWARRFVFHQTRRMLFMAQSHVADGPFHADCLKLMQKLRDAPERTLPHSVLLKRMKMDAQTFRKLIQTLEQSGDVVIQTQSGSGRPGRYYRLVEAEGDRKRSAE